MWLFYIVNDPHPSWRWRRWGNSGRSGCHCWCHIRCFGSWHLFSWSLEILESDPVQFCYAHNSWFSLLNELVLARQLVTSQSEGVSGNLLVQCPPNLEDDTVDRNSRRPMVKRTLSFTHTNLPVC